MTTHGLAGFIEREICPRLGNLFSWFEVCISISAALLCAVTYPGAIEVAMLAAVATYATFAAGLSFAFSLSLVAFSDQAFRKKLIEKKVPVKNTPLY